MLLGAGAPCAFIPCDPEAGHEAEVEWGHAIAIIAGDQVRLSFFCMRSKYPEKHFVRFYPCKRQQAFFDGHIHAFAFFGGIFPVLICDNLKTAVLKVLRGKDRIEQEAFSKIQGLNFKAIFCNPGSGNEKGGVEGLVSFAQRNYMVPVPEAGGLEEINEKILRQCTFLNFTLHFQALIFFPKVVHLIQHGSSSFLNPERLHRLLQSDVSIDPTCFH